MPTVEIPVIKQGDRVLRWETVPESWWSHEKTVLRVKDKLVNSHLGRADVVAIGVQSTQRQISGRKASSVVIYSNPDAMMSSTKPEHVDGVEIRTEQMPEIEPDADCGYTGWCDTQSHDWLPGGAVLGYNGGGFTATGSVKYDGEQCLMTCGHAFWSIDDCSPSNTNEWVTHNGKKAGKQIHMNRELDYALLERESGTEVSGYSQKVKWDSNTSYRVTGHVTQSGLHSMMSDNDTVYKYGARSCRSSGTIQGYTEDISWDDCVAEDSFVEITACTQGGDSGAPYYSTWTDSEGCTWASMVGVHKGGDSFGAPAYRVSQADSIQFGNEWNGTCGGIT